MNLSALLCMIPTCSHIWIPACIVAVLNAFHCTMMLFCLLINTRHECANGLAINTFNSRIRPIKRLIQHAFGSPISYCCGKCHLAAVRTLTAGLESNWPSEFIDLEYIYVFVWWGVCKQSRWRHSVTDPSQDGGYALLWQRYDNNKMVAMRYYSTSSTVQS